MSFFPSMPSPLAIQLTPSMNPPNHSRQAGGAVARPYYPAADPNRMGSRPQPPPGQGQQPYPPHGQGRGQGHGPRR